MPKLKNSSPNLVADIGGTNARFALVDGADGIPYETMTLPCAEYPTLSEAADMYLSRTTGTRPKQAVISIATPVMGDQLKMTNHVWAPSIEKTRASLNLTSLQFINDYTALALALPFLTNEDCVQVGNSSATPEGQTMAVLGPGTGLGVSAVTRVNNYWLPLQGEGGHVTYGPLDQRETDIIQIIRKQYDHISAERLVSGPGLSLIYQSIIELEGLRLETLDPKSIIENALQKNSTIAEETVSLFCAILGTIAGNLALTLGARAGVYIGGGIIPRLAEYFDTSPFRERFDSHGRFTQYLEKIPTYVIRSKYPALRGAAVALGSDYANLGFTSKK